MSLLGWKALTCPDCEGDEFIKVIGLQRHPSGGSSEIEKGYVCQQCGSHADVDLMWNHVLIAEREQEIRDYQEQMEQTKEVQKQRVARRKKAVQ